MPLWNLGWCSYYHLESKVMNHPNKKTQIIEFYWFNRKFLDRERRVASVYIVAPFLF